jgi:hypothetical protein
VEVGGVNIEEIWQRKLLAKTHRHAKVAEAGMDARGVIKLDSHGAERYARLYGRDVIVYERMPLHFWKMNDSAKEMETRRITMALIKKMKKVYGTAPTEIVGEGEADA